MADGVARSHAPAAATAAGRDGPGAVAARARWFGIREPWAARHGAGPAVGLGNATERLSAEAVLLGGWIEVVGRTVLRERSKDTERHVSGMSTAKDWQMGLLNLIAEHQV